MEIELTSDANDDLSYWKKTGNQAILKRIRLLTESILETPFSGIGKPEPLKHNLSGKWSRRIDKSNRYVYEVQENIVYVFSLKGHYNN
jgi:toxin YoeB